MQTDPYVTRIGPVHRGLGLLKSISGGQDRFRDLFAAYDWETGEYGVHHGTVTLAHDHRENDIADHLHSVQHDRTGIITATQHSHIAHDQCLETITVNGPKAEISELATELRSIDGVSQVKVVVVDG